MAPGGSDVGSYRNKGHGVRTSNVMERRRLLHLKSGRYQTERTCPLNAKNGHFLYPSSEVFAVGRNSIHGP
jgi:hypothetical protein